MLLADICEDFKETAEEKNIKINFESDSKKHFILGDQDKLKQVFINLQSNAVKFNKDGGSVWVSISENEENKIVVKIKDNGQGVNKEDIPFIFERLYRGDKSRHKIQGAGIGLTIVKKILSMHSAVIDVESETDKGSTFTIYFYKEEKI